MVIFLNSIEIAITDLHSFQEFESPWFMAGWEEKGTQQVIFRHCKFGSQSTFMCSRTEAYIFKTTVIARASWEGRHSKTLNGLVLLSYWDDHQAKWLYFHLSVGHRYVFILAGLVMWNIREHQ